MVFNSFLWCMCTIQMMLSGHILVLNVHMFIWLSSPLDFIHEQPDWVCSSWVLPHLEACEQQLQVMEMVQDSGCSLWLPVCLLSERQSLLWELWEGGAGGINPAAPPRLSSHAHHILLPAAAIKMDEAAEQDPSHTSGAWWRACLRRWERARLLLLPPRCLHWPDTGLGSAAALRCRRSGCWRCCSSTGRGCHVEPSVHGASPLSQSRREMSLCPSSQSLGSNQLVLMPKFTEWKL